ncbi:E3 ubiquitin-protein ligase UBR2 isoform X3 [Marmota monax]|uniref:E3 ubiquitin-protein ligase UBR2 isoform X3 n=1 Tax=Marmota monax TaxID=9995 RepID=UPI001EAFE59A|nr:E3 ubiquitin-protein ligase UBR2 isoform X3 [Marmota monax]
MECFLGSIHRDHRYRMTTSGGGGFCDCGDTEAWKEGPYCQKHELNTSEIEEEEDPLVHLSVDVIARTYNIFAIMFRYAVEILTWEKESELPADLEMEEKSDTYYCMLFNDEVHTYEQVIYTLQKAVNCTQKEAIGFATTVDRDGRRSVRYGDFQYCEQAKSVIVRNTSRQTKPLKVQVMHSSIVAHQNFGLKLLSWLGSIIGYSDGLRRILCQVGLQEGPYGENSCLVDRLMLSDSKLWKGARSVYHQLFMSSLLMDLKYKKLFAIRFAKNYERLQSDYVTDDHDREFSIADLSVQIFTVPSLNFCSMRTWKMTRAAITAPADVPAKRWAVSSIRGARSRRASTTPAWKEGPRFRACSPQPGLPIPVGTRCQLPCQPRAWNVAVSTGLARGTHGWFRQLPPGPVQPCQVAVSKVGKGPLTQDQVQKVLQIHEQGPGPATLRLASLPGWIHLWHRLPSLLPVSGTPRSVHGSLTGPCPNRRMPLNPPQEALHTQLQNLCQWIRVRLPL